jgi:hypothetical protein
MNYWLRLYTGILDDPKVQRLEAEHFKGWVNLLCLAKEHDGLLPSLEDIAFRLRITEAEARSLVEVLVGRGLLDSTEDGLTPHNWEDRQCLSDGDPTAAIRARRYRNNKTRDVTDSVTRDASVTQQTDNGSREEKRREETEKRREEEKPARVKRATAKRPTTCDEEFLAELQATPAYSMLNVMHCYQRMVVWCTNKGVQPSRSRFINWLNREDKPMGVGNGQTQTGKNGNDPNRGSAPRTTEDYGIRDCKIL